MTDRLVNILDHNFEFIDWKFNKIDSELQRNTSAIRIIDPAVKNIHKLMKKQKRFGRSMCLFAVVTTACIIVLDRNRKELEKKIANLNEEIETLKGEQVMKC